MIGEELDQRFVRRSVHCARPKPDLQPLAVLARELGARGARLHVKLEDHTVAAATRMLFTTISATYRITRRMSGVRSTLPTGGT